jgi:hypothetical protein
VSCCQLPHGLGLGERVNPGCSVCCLFLPQDLREMFWSLPALGRGGGGIGRQLSRPVPRLAPPAVPSAAGETVHHRRSHGLAHT